VKFAVIQSDRKQDLCSAEPSLNDDRSSNFNEAREEGELGVHSVKCPRPNVAKVRIPTQSGQGFRCDVGHHSEMKPATIPK
jgi:hypothetical protein